MTAKTVRWGVVHAVKGLDGPHRLLRLALDDVPAGTNPDELRDALTEAGYADRFTEADLPWGNHSLLPESRWGAVEGVDQVDAIDWDTLRRGGGDRRVTLRLPSGLHARASGAAEAAGVSLNTFCVQAIAREAQRTLQPTEPRRPIRRAGSGIHLTARPTTD